MVPKSASVLGTQPIHPGRGTKTGPNPALLTKATEAPELPVQPSVGYKKSEVVPGPSWRDWATIFLPPKAFVLCPIRVKGGRHNSSWARSSSFLCLTSLYFLLTLCVWESWSIDPFFFGVWVYYQAWTRSTKRWRTNSSFRFCYNRRSSAFVVSQHILPRPKTRK